MEMRTRGALGPPAKRIVRSDAYGNRTPPSPPWVVILAGARARLESDAQAQVCQIRFLCHPPYK